MKEISVTRALQEKNTYIQQTDADISLFESSFALMPFYRDGVLLEQGPKWGMSVLSAGSMRFRWNEHNQNRIAFFNKLCTSQKENSPKFETRKRNELCVVPLELIHSKVIYDIHTDSDTQNKEGDGMITSNKSLVPVVTVADCMPIFLYDPVTGVFGALHSGWKGTGIVGEAIFLAEKKYGAKPENFCVALGPHIHDCCYNVDQERAEYFRTHFTAECITELTEQQIAEKIKNGADDSAKKYRFCLSLEKANLAVLQQAGVCSENVVCATDCTSCAQFADGSFVYGSSRRETAEARNAGKNVDVHSGAFTVQAAFCGWIK
jgi:polyphenol oxidase